MEIIVDERERKVIPHFKKPLYIYYGKKPIPVKLTIKTLAIGDYSINYKGKIIYIIERKTLKDLASSLIDGRKDNVNKLLNLREKQTGKKCKIMYLIEGRFNPKRAMVGRIPFKNLRAHLDHLTYRDDIHVDYSLSEEHTTERLLEICENYYSLIMKDKSIFGGCDEDNGGNESNKNDDSGEDGGEEYLLYEKTEKTEEQILEAVMCSVRGIGRNTSEVLMKNNIYLINLIDMDYDILHEKLANMRHDNGRKLSTKMIGRIMCLRDKLNKKNTKKNIISSIPTIGTIKVKKILASGINFAEFIKEGKHKQKIRDILKGNSYKMLENYLFKNRNIEIIENNRNREQDGEQNNTSTTGKKPTKRTTKRKYDKRKLTKCAIINKKPPKSPRKYNTLQRKKSKEYYRKVAEEFSDMSVS